MALMREEKGGSGVGLWESVGVVVVVWVGIGGLEGGGGVARPGRAGGALEDKGVSGREGRERRMWGGMGVVNGIGRGCFLLRIECLWAYDYRALRCQCRLGFCWRCLREWTKDTMW